MWTLYFAPFLKVFISSGSCLVVGVEFHVRNHCVQRKSCVTSSFICMSFLPLAFCSKTPKTVE